MSKYAGLCIAGPYDGQYHVVSSTRLEAFEHSQRPISLGPIGNEAVPADAGVTRTVYVFNRVGDVGLWIPEGNTLADAMEALANAYVAAVRRS